MKWELVIGLSTWVAGVLLVGCGKGTASRDHTDSSADASATSTQTPSGNTLEPSATGAGGGSGGGGGTGSESSDDDETSGGGTSGSPDVPDDDTSSPPDDDLDDDQNTSDDTAGPNDDDTADDDTADDDTADETSTPDPGDAGSQTTDPEQILPPQTSNEPTNKLDLLFVIDNSMSMTGHQQLLADSLPELLELLVEQVENIHVGVITTSLGGFGAEANCTDAERGQRDVSHLIGSLPRAVGSGAGDFMRWCSGASRDASECTESAEGSSVQTFTTAFRNQLLATGEFGCGFEASLESWYRFLIEPNPWTSIVRQPCSASESPDLNLCVGPATVDGTPLVNGGTQAVDQVLLDQRAAFLRDDSVVAVVMLTDENDCSFKVIGQSWRLSTTSQLIGTGQPVRQFAFKGTAVCRTDPNSPCCHSCGLSPGAGCPTEIDSRGLTVAEGCGNQVYEAGSDDAPTEDAANLRCFAQKQRFGVDYLYPVERYSNGLRYAFICPSRDDVDPQWCAPDDLVENPLFKSADGSEENRRPASRVFLAGILGVPWQDLAVDHAAPELVYRNNRAAAPAAERIDWSLLLGDDNQPPGDPLMIEQIAPRSGVHPITGEAVAPPESDYMAHSINGHEWNIARLDDLQYACIYPLPELRACPTAPDSSSGNCECSTFADARYQNPVCQQPDGSYGLTQGFGKAFPGVRQLRVLHDFGDNAIVTSICARQTDDSASPNYGYRPALRALVNALGREL